MFNNLQGFFESIGGQIVIVGMLLLFFALILIPGKGEKNKKADTKALTVSALMVALAMGLNQLTLFRMSQGGSITLFSMLPIAICAFLLGTRRGVIAGICLGLLDLIFNPYVIHPVQFLVDYPLAFGTLGVGGIFRNRKNGLVKGYLLGIFGRYLCAVFSGTVFFGSYAPEGFSPLAWSLWYNFTYLAVEGILTVIIISIPPVKKALEGLKKQM